MSYGAMSVAVAKSLNLPHAPLVHELSLQIQSSHTLRVFSLIARTLPSTGNCKLDDISSNYHQMGSSSIKAYPPKHSDVSSVRAVYLLSHNQFELMILTTV